MESPPVWKMKLGTPTPHLPNRKGLGCIETEIRKRQGDDLGKQFHETLPGQRLRPLARQRFGPRRVDNADLQTQDPVASIAGNHPVAMASFSSVVDNLSAWREYRLGADPMEDVPSLVAAKAHGWIVNYIALRADSSYGSKEETSSTPRLWCNHTLGCRCIVCARLDRLALR